MLKLQQAALLHDSKISLKCNLYMTISIGFDYFHYNYINKTLTNND
jgi:hypothetical protein